MLLNNLKVFFKRFSNAFEMVPDFVSNFLQWNVKCYFKFFANFYQTFFEYFTEVYQKYFKYVSNVFNCFSYVFTVVQKVFK